MPQPPNTTHPTQDCPTCGAPHLTTAECQQCYKFPGSPMHLEELRAKGVHVHE